MRYRDHRGSLDESLKTTIIVNSKSELISHLNTVWSQYDLSVFDIDFDYCGFDERCGWDTYYVTQQVIGINDDKFFIAGMSDGKFFNNN